MRDLHVASRGSHPLRPDRRRGGFSYIEVLIAVAVVALSLVPALEALRTGILGSAVHQSVATRHRHLTSKMEEVLARSFLELEIEAIAAGGAPTSYSDPVAAPDRRLVYLSGYDGDDSDEDGDPFTGTDPGLLWVRVEIENTGRALESLTTL